jgi:hypothetical protein
MATPTAVCLVLLAVLLGAGFAFEGGEERAASPVRAAPVSLIAQRVERIRELRFEQLPRPLHVTPDQARREGLEDFDRSYPPERRRADEQVLKLLGLIEPDVDLRKVSASVFGEGVAGYYDPRTERLRIVEGAQTANRVLQEITLAHELTHALEDQRFDLDLEEIEGSDDPALAYLALVEGTATALMLEYADRHFSAEQTLGGLLSSLGQATGDLPPFLMAQLVFPYTAGQRFVERLHRAGGWAVVNAAFRFRPPSSSEQVLHPEKYLRVEQPERVHLDPARVLGEGWRRLAAGTWGEWATGELLLDNRAAAGWGGDRYELWRSGARDALVMRWRYDTPAEARELAESLRVWAEKPRAAGTATASRGREVTLALAPTQDLGDRLARQR